MEKNDMTLRRGKVDELDFIKFFSLASITAALANTRIMHQLAAFYTYLLDHQVTPRQAVFTLYAQLASVIALLPYNINMGWRALFIYLFYQAIKRANLFSKLWKSHEKYKAVLLPVFSNRLIINHF